MRTFKKNEILNILETSSVGSQFVIDNGHWVIIEKTCDNRYDLYKDHRVGLSREIIYNFKNNKNKMMDIKNLTVGDIGTLQLNYLEDIPSGQQMLSDLLPIIESKIREVNNELYRSGLGEVKYDFNNSTTIADVNEVIKNVNEAVDNYCEYFGTNWIDYLKIKKLEEK